MIWPLKEQDHLILALSWIAVFIWGSLTGHSDRSLETKTESDILLYEVITKFPECSRLIGYWLASLTPEVISCTEMSDNVIAEIDIGPNWSIPCKPKSMCEPPIQAMTVLGFTGVSSLSPQVTLANVEWRKTFYNVKFWYWSRMFSSYPLKTTGLNTSLTCNRCCQEL